MNKNKWTNTYQHHILSYPPEYIISIFKCSYPALQWNKNFENKNICDISAGDGRNLPLLQQLGFKVYVTEINEDIINIVKQNIGYLILSISKKTCFIYKNAEYYTDNIIKIKNDPFQIRNNTYMYVYQDEEHIKNIFSEYFNTIASTSIHNNCFGYYYHWHILMMQRNTKNV